MFVGIFFSVFLAIAVIISMKKEEKQNEFKKKIEDLENREYWLNKKSKLLMRQKRELCDIIISLLDMPDKINDAEKDRVLKKIKKEIESLAKNIFENQKNDGYNFNEEITKRLKIMNSKILQFLILIDNDEYDFDEEDFDEDEDDFDDDDDDL